MKKFLATTVLLALPVITVQGLKKTEWGEMKSTPPSRQQGDPKAKVLIVEFSDFQCPTCAGVQPFVHQILETYKGKVRFVYKYYPLTKIHSHAMSAAHAAECAGAQEKFWGYQEQLFKQQRQWAPLPDATTTFMSIAQSLQLDMDAFQKCTADSAKRWPIQADIDEGKDREVNATPTFFIGDERLVGQQFVTEGARTIEKVLRQK